MYFINANKDWLLQFPVCPRPHLNFKLHGIGPDYALPQLLPKREADIVEKEPTVEQSVKSNGRTWREDDYVSSRKPPPGFEKWLDYASTHQCHMGSYKQIEANLEVYTVLWTYL